MALSRQNKGPRYRACKAAVHMLTYLQWKVTLLSTQVREVRTMNNIHTVVSWTSEK